MNIGNKVVIDLEIYEELKDTIKKTEIERNDARNALNRFKNEIMDFFVYGCTYTYMPPLGDPLAPREGRFYVDDIMQDRFPRIRDIIESNNDLLTKLRQEVL